MSKRLVSYEEFIETTPEEQSHVKAITLDGLIEMCDAISTQSQCDAPGGASASEKGEAPNDL